MNDGGTRGGHDPFTGSASDSDDDRPSLSEIHILERLIGERASWPDVDFHKLHFTSFTVGEFEEVIEIGVEHEAGDFRGTRTEGADDPCSTRLLEFDDSFFTSCASDDLKRGSQESSGENDIDIVGIGREDGCERLSAIDPGLFEDGVVGGVTCDEEPLSAFARLSKDVFVRINDDKRLIPSIEVIADGESHAAQSADDVVPGEGCESDVHTAPFEKILQFAADEPFPHFEGGEGKQTEGDHEVSHDEDPSGITEVDDFPIADGGHCDDRHVEAVDPTSPLDQAKSCRPTEYQSEQKSEDEIKPFHASPK